MEQRLDSLGLPTRPNCYDDRIKHALLPVIHHPPRMPILRAELFGCMADAGDLGPEPRAADEPVLGPDAAHLGEDLVAVREGARPAHAGEEAVEQGVELQAGG